MTTEQDYILATRGGGEGLTTESIPSGVGGNQSVSETFSEAVYSRTFATGLLPLVNKVSAASAYRCRDVSALADVEVPGEGSEYTFLTDYTFAETRATLQTFIVATKVSNELMADYGIQSLLAQVMAGQLAERLNNYIAERIGIAIGGTDRHERGTVVSGVLTGPLLTRVIFGRGTAAGGQPAGQMFSNADYEGLVICSNANVFGEMVAGGGFQASYPADLQDFRTERGQCHFAGLPWHFISSMPQTAVSALITQPHVIIFDPRYVSLAMQPMQFRVDSESLAATNQSIIHASVRAEAFLGGISHAAGISIKAIAT
jgi:hypothetical protein